MFTYEVLYRDQAIAIVGLLVCVGELETLYEYGLPARVVCNRICLLWVQKWMAIFRRQGFSGRFRSRSKTGGRVPEFRGSYSDLKVQVMRNQPPQNRGLNWFDIDFRVPTYCTPQRKLAEGSPALATLAPPTGTRPWDMTTGEFYGQVTDAAPILFLFYL
jgi:hypothetical protein